MDQPYSWKEIYGFCSVLLCKVEGNFLYLEGRFNGGFFALRVSGAYIWRGLYMEGLIFGILGYVPTMLGFVGQQCCVRLHKALHLTPFLFHWQVIHLKRFQLVNNHWVKSNKIVQFPMEGFDPSAFLAKPSRSGTSSAITSDGGVTTVNVKSSEELVNEEETEERKEATARQGSEVSTDC